MAHDQVHVVAQKILDYAPHVETAWQGDGVCAVPIRYIVELKRAMEATGRVKSIPYGGTP